MIKVTMLTPEEIMRQLGFDNEHTDWAELIYTTLEDNADIG